MTRRDKKGSDIKSRACRFESGQPDQSFNELRVGEMALHPISTLFRPYHLLGRGSRTGRGMGNEGGSSSTGDIVRTVAGIIDKVPVYDDALKPAAKEVGKTLHTLAKAINLAISPVAAAVWGGEQIIDFVQRSVQAKLANVTIERIQAPSAHVGVPLLEALRYTGADSELSELYANLLANSMDETTAHTAHPAFVEMIRNLTPDEARVLRHLAGTGNQAVVDVKIVSPIVGWLRLKGSHQVVMRNVSMIGDSAGCEHPSLMPTYIDNLARLGLIGVANDRRITSDAPYDAIEGSPLFLQVRSQLGSLKWRQVQFEKHLLFVTELGRQFIRACVDDKASSG